MTNKSVFLDQKKKRYTIKDNVGSGGEGDIYSVNEDDSIVIKLYRERDRKERFDKLSLMTEAFDERLESISAWPKSIIYDQTQVARGFVMPKINGCKPIHELHNPSARKKYFPEVDYAFLIQAAKNVVAAIASIHSKGFVVGDVNEGNLLISNTSTVKLIDCDSFQISFNGEFFPCEVGIPMYTPPELQDSNNFKDQVRTINHDLFGMSVICFQLLFMGRHPYVGLYKGPDVPLEKAIQKYWFAYGQPGLSKAIKPPTEVIPFESIPRGLQILFEKSFTEEGALKRPSPADWIRELNHLKQNLRLCLRESKHKYFSNLNFCPWCEFESRTGIDFFLTSKISPLTFSDFNVDEIWKRIEEIEMPSEEIPNPLSYSVKAKPLANQLMVGKLVILLKKVLAVVLTIILIVVNPTLFFLWAILGTIVYNINLFENIINGEKKKREDALSKAKGLWNDVSNEWKSQASDDLFNYYKLTELKNAKEQYLGLRGNYGREKRELHHRMEELQLQKHLRNFFIRNFSIPQIGKNRISVLTSYGVETAADVMKLKRLKIPGFGDFLEGQLWQWRNSMAVNFKFDPAKGIDPDEINKLNKKYSALNQRLQNALRNGPERLMNTREMILAKRNSLRKNANEAALNLAQADKDLRAL